MSQEIRAIDQESIHRICSGQVVVDLATAVKEMVENSLDAKATMIEIKLKNFGADSIEVSDNGTGIAAKDYDGIALKHHTSKLQNFEDLFSVASFGFRGEALNSLCELSGKFTVITKQSHEPVGALLTFDRMGRLASQTIAPRSSSGTTVLVENLFEALPVRRAEFLRYVKVFFFFFFFFFFFLYNLL